MTTMQSFSAKKQLDNQDSFFQAIQIVNNKPLTRTVPKDESVPNYYMSLPEEGYIESLIPQPSNEPQFQPTDYKLESKLGNGEFGEVFLARSKIDNEKVVMKRISKSAKNFKWKYVDRETQVGRVLYGIDHIISCTAKFETPNNIYLVFPYFEGVDMITWMEQRDFQPVEAKKFKPLFKQLVNALINCHNNGIGHRDIKCDNVLVDKKGSNIQLIDFGLSSVEDSKDKRQNEGVGSMQYVAPELLIGDSYKSFKADVFSTGCVLYCMIFGEFPFNQEERMSTLRAGRVPEVNFKGDSVPHKVPKKVKDLISKMLEHDPERRISMEDVLEHKWLKSKFHLF